MRQNKPGGTKTLWAVIAGALLCVALVWVGLRWPAALRRAEIPTEFPFQNTQSQAAPMLHPLLELLKLAVAALVGILVTAIHRRSLRDKPLGRSMEQAQILLCVAGALIIIIIGNSLARAFGIAGAASLIRFRTPVKDPKDITILFLLLGLGMCCGLGAFAIAGLGTAFIALLLLVLDQVGEPKRRKMVLAVVAAEGQEFPADHVRNVFLRHGIAFEPCEFLHGDQVAARYHARIGREVSLEEVTTELMAGGSAGIKSISWKKAKKKGEE